MFDDDGGGVDFLMLMDSTSSESDSSEDDTPEGPVNHWAVWTEVVVWGLLVSAVVVWVCSMCGFFGLIGP